MLHVLAGMGKTVVIIGAGYAGLGAAQALLAEGQHKDLKVILLEGGDRVGGRANTRNVEGLGRVEFGATYFHGLKDHPLYDAAVNAEMMDPVDSKGMPSPWSCAVNLF